MRPSHHHHQHGVPNPIPDPTPPASIPPPRLDVDIVEFRLVRGPTAAHGTHTTWAARYGTRNNTLAPHRTRIDLLHSPFLSTRTAINVIAERCRCNSWYVIAGVGRAPAAHVDEPGCWGYADMACCVGWGIDAVRMCVLWSTYGGKFGPKCVFERPGSNPGFSVVYAVVARTTRHERWPFIAIEQACRYLPELTSICLTCFLEAADRPIGRRNSNMYS
jgi:hypothetical protein